MPAPPLPRVLCRGHKGWTGVVYKCHQPVIQPGEEGGKVVRGAQCVLCRSLEAASVAERLDREAKRTEKRAATGKLTTVLPDDAFQGFR